MSNGPSRRGLLTTLAAAVAATAAPAARAADPSPLAVGTMPTDSSAEAFYAVDQGFFRAVGLDASLTVMTNTASLAAAVSGGAIEMGYGSVVPLAEARARGLGFRLVAPASVYDGTPTNFMMVAKSSPYQKAADLDGKTIAVNGLRDLTQYTVQAWIAENGGDVKSIKLIEIPFSEMGAALAQGRVDAAIVAEPYATMDKTQARIIGNSAGAVAKRYMVTGWFSTDAWLQKNGDRAKRFAEAIARAAKWANGHQKESAAILVRYTKIEPEVAAQIVRAIYGEGRPEPALIQPVIDVAVKYGTLQPLAASALIWPGAG